MNRSVTSSRVVKLGMVAALVFAATPSMNSSTAAAAEPASIKVKVSDLDLASEEGKDTLARRLAVAIDKVCAQAGNVNPAVTAPSRIQRCRTEVEANVRRQLEQHGVSPVLVARH
jgi:UrcA family protein